MPTINARSQLFGLFLRESLRYLDNTCHVHAGTEERSRKGFESLRQRKVLFQRIDARRTANRTGLENVHDVHDILARQFFLRGSNREREASESVSFHLNVCRVQHNEVHNFTRAVRVNAHERITCKHQRHNDRRIERRVPDKIHVGILNPCWCATALAERVQFAITTNKTVEGKR